MRIHTDDSNRFAAFVFTFLQQSIAFLVKFMDLTFIFLDSCQQIKKDGKTRVFTKIKFLCNFHLQGMVDITYK